jgi:hypothetical protein
VTPADEKYLRLAREKIAGYPGLAREALRRREYDKAEELLEAVARRDR